MIVHSPRDWKRSNLIEGFESKAQVLVNCETGKRPPLNDVADQSFLACAWNPLRHCITVR